MGDSMENNSVAVIVAAGTGKRMGGTVKKQYLEIHGFPVLYFTLKAFEESNIDRIVIVTGKDEVDYVRREIVEKYGIKKVSRICAGGKERYDSVYEGLKNAAGNQKATENEKATGDRKATGNDNTSENGSTTGDKNVIGNDNPTGDKKTSVPEYVLVHDGVRPFAGKELINRMLDAVKEKKACVAAVTAKDTIKEVIDGKITKTFDRKLLYQIQTPQAFDYSLLLKAYEAMYLEKENGTAPEVTDDAMLIEHYSNQKVSIVPGDYRNIKITTPEDLLFAEAIMGGL